jgi:hypothetical protein
MEKRRKPNWIEYSPTETTKAPDTPREMATSQEAADTPRKKTSQDILKKLNFIEMTQYTKMTKNAVDHIHNEEGCKQVIIEMSKRNVKDWLQFKPIAEERENLEHAEWN